jgi:hypothetical protein
MALSAFEKAFKTARQSGENEFEFNGKKYTTKYKEESETSSKPTAKAKASSDKPMQDASKMYGSVVGSTKTLPVDESNYQMGSVPTPQQAAANRQAAMNKVKSIGSSISDYFSNFETPAERRSREAKEEKNYKKGGSVSSASKRADGIAQRGKTRGRMM